MYGEASGAVYLYDTTTDSDTETQKYVQDNNEANGNITYAGGEFGISVALSSDSIIVGADYARGMSNELSGVVYLGSLGKSKSADK
jgi:hypothetical protein